MRSRLGKTEAFVLIGGLTPLSRRTAYLDVLDSHGLVPLIIDEPAIAARLGQAAQDQLAAPTNVGLARPDEHEKVLGIVRRWQERYEIRGMYCVSEPFVEAASILADYLSVPFPGLRAGRVCRNKVLQRMHFPDLSPDWTVILPAQRASSKAFQAYPAVLKPVARHSSSGVVAVACKEDVERAIHAYPADETLLLESRVIGREFSIEALVQGGEVVFESITQKDTNEQASRHFVEMGHLVPARDLAPGDRERLLTANRSVLSGLGFENGIAHAEYRVAADRIVLMEVAARAPGCGILQLYLLATGRPMEAAIIDIALGIPTSYPAPGRYAKQVYVQHAHGILDDVTVMGSNAPPVVWLENEYRTSPMWPVPEGRVAKVRLVHVLKQIGDELGDIAESNDRAVSFFIDGHDPLEFENLHYQFMGELQIKTRDHADEMTD